MDAYPQCASLLEGFMEHFLPTLWRGSTTDKQAALQNIARWLENEETVSALDRFARWDSYMVGAFPATMQDLYNKLGFERGRADRVASPSDPAVDWTFTVHVIRFAFLHKLTSHAQKAFRDRFLCIQLLDDMEKAMVSGDISSRTPSPHRERRVRDTPEPKGGGVHCLLQRLLTLAE